MKYSTFKEPFVYENILRLLIFTSFNYFVGFLVEEEGCRYGTKKDSWHSDGTFFFVVRRTVVFACQIFFVNNIREIMDIRFGWNRTVLSYIFRYALKQFRCSVKDKNAAFSINKKKMGAMWRTNWKLHPSSMGATVFLSRLRA